MSAGFSTTLGLKADGTVVTAGYTGHLQLEVGHWKDIVAIDGGTTFSVGLQADGSVLVAGDLENKEQVESWEDIVAIEARGGSVLGQKADGTVLAVGEFFTGNLTEEMGWTDIVSFSAGGSSLVGLKEDGTSVAIGPNAAGEINISPLRYYLTDIVESVQVNKTNVSSGEKVLVTVAFSESIQHGVGIALRGAQNSESMQMTEVENSNGRVYQYEFNALEEEGAIHFHFTNIIDSEGFLYDDRFANNLVQIDNTAPKFYGGETLTIPVHSEFNPLVGITAYDTVDQFITSNIMVDGEVDTHQLGTYTLIYTATDQAGNKVTKERDIIVVDEEAPVFQGVTDTTIGYGRDWNSMQGVSAIDNLDGDVTSDITVTGTVDTLKVGEHVLTYSVEDRSGNIATAERVITVIDDIFPVITGIEDVEIGVNDSFDPLAGVTAHDNVDGEIPYIEVLGKVNVSVPGTYTLRYTVVDNAGNMTSLERAVTVADKGAPVLIGVDDVVIPMRSSFNVMEGVTATDNFDGDLTSEVLVSGKVDTNVDGKYFITYTVTDSSDNTTFKTRTITVVKSGWIEENGTWFYYVGLTGKKKTGWLEDGNKWYYLDATGVMQTGWVISGGKWYYMNPSGAMQTGWVSVGGKWYYMNTSGAMQTGWVSSGGKWYYMNTSGAMQTGWVSTGGKWYYMDASGAMKTGWVSDGGKWYYMDASGVMKTGWILDGGKWYYLNASGVWVK
ncbi:immunoglobulin-like domain-containing protein [Fredinandcohnia sp. 179-A 10B2 NHS]|uniref:immunoglobulin-like domain-containing protein n=1 Tax=Fredinandcohnia sp. 179-A 10B2 NHS TaxID=3235176 RepID=UPI00399F8242